MKFKSLCVAVLLMGSILMPPAHAANEKPFVETFTFTPQEIELTGGSTEVSFELIVSHAFGIENSFTTLTLQNARNDVLTTILRRQDSDLNSTRVTFKGTLSVPRTINSGVYNVFASSVKNNSAAGYQYGTGIISIRNFRTLIGGESALLVRSGGDLNFDYETFIGPSFNSSLGLSFNDPAKYNFMKTPIWKVGETVDLNDYYELRVPTLALQVTTSTPNYCSADSTSLTLLKEGTCTFQVLTPKTKDYAPKSSSQSVMVTSQRIKQSLAVEKIPDQDIKDLGKSIPIGRVFSVTEGFVLPLSPTPTICLANGFFVKLISAGTCKLTYQTAATSLYLASDLYTVSFEILKDGQPVVAPAPVATPTPTPSAVPVAKKTISCVKGKKTVNRTGTSPKCPKGYKLKK